MERPTFSQSWSRVSRLTPMLRPQVQVRRRVFRGQPWFVLHDPIGNGFFRLNPVAFHFVGLLDGVRSVDEVWRMTLERYGDDAPTQPEVIGLLGQLNQSNLLRVDLPADAEPLLRRQQRRLMQRWSGQAMSVLFLQTPLINPDRLLRWLSPFFRPVLSKLGLILWVLWLLLALAIFLPHLRQFTLDTGSILAPANWGWAALVFVLVKAWHELGHGLICRRLGGSVHEAGIMLLVLFPCPYVDASSAWGLDSKWKRALIGAAGMMFELTLAAGAAILWVHTESGTLPHQLAHTVVLLASVATLLFNANPLMRFDGYFILSDLLEMPNLYDRANQQLKYLWQRWIMGLKSVSPISSQAGESALLTLYGIGALIYRFVVMIGIILLVAGFFSAMGLALALWTAIAWLLIPAGKFIHWLATSSALHRKRGRAVATTLAVAVIVLLALGAYPARDHRRTVGVVEAADRSDVSVTVPGLVDKVQAHTGQPVKAGQVLLVLENLELRSAAAQLRAQVDYAAIDLKRALADQPAERLAAAAKLQAVQQKLAELETKLEELVLRSPRDGILLAPAMDQLQGQYLKPGTLLAQVVDMNSLRITALVDQSQNTLALLKQVELVEMRGAGMIDRVTPTRLLEVFQSGRSQLPHPALGYVGGGTIPTDQEDRQGRTAARPQFELWLALPRQDPDNRPLEMLPGQRVYLRFTLQQRRPWAWQWLHTLRQLLRERITL